MNILQPDNSSQLYKEKYDLDIERLAGRTLKQLCADNENLLVFPQILGLHKDGIENLTLISKQRHNADEVTINTGNLMGFVGFGDSQITIYSRFARSCRDTTEDYFLHYMMQRVFAINMFDMRHQASDDDIFDFLILLFPYFLKRALRQGLFKQYRTREYNDANIRGVIDVSKHIRCNIPFNGRVAYRTREYDYDNNITQLIRHTIEYIKQNSTWSSVLYSDRDIKDAVSTIVFATRNYAAKDRDKIIGCNHKALHHPYFTDYTPLQRLCVRILQHKKLKFGKSDNSTYGILFDGSWLWEEYLYASVLQSCGFKHPQNKSGKGGIWLFNKQSGEQQLSTSRHRRYPDYFREGLILDAKYKHLDNNCINRDDMHQIIAYMYAEASPAGGFIYPAVGADDGRLIVCDSLGTLRGYNGKVYNIGFRIPQQATSYKHFVELMQEVEQELHRHIEHLINDCHK